MEFIDLGAQYRELKTAIDKRIQSVLAHGQYIMGPEVFELEDRLGEFVNISNVISCANGTDALQLVLMAAGISPGDAVFVPTFTFFASAEVVPLVGATPIFVDVDEGTFNIDVCSLEQKIEETIVAGALRPRAIIAVDLFGLPADYVKLQAVAKKYGLLLIEDAAQGFGGKLGHQRACSFGDVATTSFFPAKPLGCYGDGGAIFTDDLELANVIRSLRVHGKGSDKYDNIRVGLNSRLDTIQAAILLEKLKAFPFELECRNKVANEYSAQLGEIYRVPRVPEGSYSSWAQYTLTHENRDNLMAYLKRRGIPTMIYYGTCLHLQTAFSNLGYKKGDFPVAERLSEQVFSLPMHPYLTDAQIARVTSALLEV